jgi:protein-tyrosine phosphatase
MSNSIMTCYSSIDIMQDYLKTSMNATDDELSRIENLLDLKREQTNMNIPSSDFYWSPSVILDNFLYHGDLGHACNIELLKDLDIRNILNVCDCSLDTSTFREFNIQWIDIQDEFKTDIKQYFEKTNTFISQCKIRNEKVLVNCQMGISRSATIVLAYLMK